MIKYSENHTWVKQVGDNWRCGITAYIKAKLGKLVHVEMPLVGNVFQRGEVVVILESSKSAIEVCSPCEGQVTAINNTIVNDVHLLNEQPEDLGWLFELNSLNVSEIENLLSLESYNEMIQED
ncbi:glycine cleavage system protein H [Candidatus Clavichlamydia salmonicola]|uniref:glycine cleavage system protein H n=1 Tax=Candidatus Clavichlamydia salmonicola TaxID=469812 RepID=UPI001891D526|nr:glycine cleavage system protein H [Candidatus Clavichlamydia salmonicola]